MSANRTGGFCAKLARLCLLGASGLTILAAIGGAVWFMFLNRPLVALGLVLFMIAWMKTPKIFRGSGWSHGTAAFAKPVELADAGMLGSKGLLVGKVPSPTLWQCLGVLLRNRGDPESACRLFLQSLAKRREMSWARLTRGTHSVVFAGSGRGKGAGIVINTLRTDPRSTVVIDPKGENALASADFRRRRFGHEIVLLDPFRQVTNYPDTFNPLSLIDDSDWGLDLARSVAESLVISTGQEREPHWNASAELHIWTIIAYVMSFPQEERNLQIVREILGNVKMLDQAIKRIEASTDWGGMLQGLGSQLRYFIDRERGSVLTTTNRFLNFLSTIPVAESTGSTNFDPRRLRTGKMTCYLILPVQFLRSHAGLLRLWLNGLMQATIQGGARETGQVHWILDEAASFGHLNIIDDAVERMRGFGTRLTFIYQSMGQLQSCFPDGRSVTFLSNMDNQIYFGTNDTSTANAISDKLGMATITVRSENGGRSISSSQDRSMNEQKSRSMNYGFNIAETGRKLQTPDEIMNADERAAYVFTPGVKPFKTYLVRYYEPAFQSLLHRPSRFLLLARSLGLLIFVAVVGLCFVGIAYEDYQRKAQSAPAMFPPNEKGINHGQERGNGNALKKGKENGRKPLRSVPKTGAP